MIYFTQLIYVVPGREAEFHAFEEIAIPAMAQYGGKLLMRIRPDRGSFIAGEEEPPYEIHLVSFEDEAGFQGFTGNEARRRAMHLKETSVSRIVLIRGQAI